jgi:molecular chaperone GrpE
MRRVKRDVDELEQQTAAAAGNEVEPAQAPDLSEPANDEPRGLEPVPEPEVSPESGAGPDPDEITRALRAEVEELREEILRRRAEFENFRKRAERERGQASDSGIGALLSELLPTLDNLERALRASEGEGLREGVELILRDLATMLSARGLEAEEPKGHPFDPERHEAVAHEPAPGVEAGTIVEVFQKGYLFKNRLLRPALVLVAKDEEGSPADEALH